MASLSVDQAYRLVQPPSGGIEGYYVENKYHDPRKIKQQKERVEAASKGERKITNAPKSKPKQSYLADIQKAAAKMPAPGQYNTREGDFDKVKPPNRPAVKSVDRVTLFEGIQKQAKKNNFPSSQAYQFKDSLVDPRHKSSFAKAEGSTFIANSMGTSILTPGVGQYNTNKDLWEKKGITKWTQSKPKQKSEKQKSPMPPVGSYSPNPVAYNLFQSSKGANKGGVKIGTSARFSNSKQIVDASYNIISEWGLKDKKEQDILKKLSDRKSSKSVYY